MEIMIKGKPVVLTAPPSHTARQVALTACATQIWVGLGAALGICLPLSFKLKASLAKCSYDGLMYGAAVRDELHAMGATDDEIMNATSEAIKLIVDSYPKETAVEAHADFTDPPPEGSTL